MNANTNLSKRKSIPLTPEQFAGVKKLIKDHHGNKSFAAETMDISRVALDRLLLKKSTSHETYHKILAILEREITTAA